MIVEVGDVYIFPYGDQTEKFIITKVWTEYSSIYINRLWASGGVDSAVRWNRVRNTYKLLYHTDGLNLLWEDKDE